MEKFQIFPGLSCIEIRNISTYPIDGIGDKHEVCCLSVITLSKCSFVPCCSFVHIFFLKQKVQSFWCFVWKMIFIMLGWLYKEVVSVILFIATWHKTRIHNWPTICSVSRGGRHSNEMMGDIFFRCSDLHISGTFSWKRGASYRDLGHIPTANQCQFISLPAARYNGLLVLPRYSHTSTMHCEGFLCYIRKVKRYASPVIYCEPASSMYPPCIYPWVAPHPPSWVTIRRSHITLCPSFLFLFRYNASL